MHTIRVFEADGVKTYVVGFLGAVQNRGVWLPLISCTSVEAALGALSAINGGPAPEGTFWTDVSKPDGLGELPEQPVE